jgi:hypothetical protein
MASSRRRFAIWACVLGTATLVVGIATTALAGKGLKTKSETENVDPGENGSATARCGQGTKAVSGGFEAEFDGLGGPTPLFYMSESRRSGGREWTSSGFNIGGEDGDLTSFAYCRDQKLKTKSKTTEVDPGDLDSVTARCKQGEKAFSGGFSAEEINLSGTTPLFYLTESHKQGKREWTVAAFNDGNADGDLTAYVGCRKGKGVKTKSAEESFGVSGDVDSAEARCSRKQRVVSGGFDLDSNWTTTGALGTGSKKVGQRGWEAAAINAGGSHDLTAYAYCEKKKKKK